MSDQASGATATRIVYRDKRATPVHDIVTGGIEGGVGVLALDPLLSKLRGGGFKNPLRGGVKDIAGRVGSGALVGAGATGLIGALVSHIAHRKKKEQEMSMSDTLSGIIELAVDTLPRAKKKNRGLVTAAGIGAIAAGAATFPAARRIIGIKTRQVAAENLGIAKAAKNIGGKTVADYIEGAQLGLNRGVKGIAVGKTIEHVLAHPEGKVAGVFKKVPGAYGSNDLGQRLANEHFARFRASPKSALNFWDYEHGLLKEGLHKKQDALLVAKGVGTSDFTKGLRKRASDEMHYGREKAHAAIKEQIEVHGKNEMDAIKHVAYKHEDPQVQHYFKELAKTKTGAVDMYAKKALLSPGLIAAGTAGVVYGRKNNQTPSQAVKARVHFYRLVDSLTELDTYDPMSDRSLRSGVRLDKYEKGIRAHEIDRHIHDYLRTAAIGAVAGAAIPARQSLRKRALTGAGAGVLVAGVLHAAGHKDEYGEQSEEAKLTQRNAPKYAAAAAVVGGLIVRHRKAIGAVKRVVRDV